MPAGKLVASSLRELLLLSQAQDKGKGKNGEMLFVNFPTCSQVAISLDKYKCFVHMVSHRVTCSVNHCLAGGNSGSDNE